jgi:hypothetical protein
MTIHWKALEEHFLMVLAALDRLIVSEVINFHKFS